MKTVLGHAYSLSSDQQRGRRSAIRFGKCRQYAASWSEHSRKKHLPGRRDAGALFVVFYEEPTLRKKFGTDYEEYCRNVHRWRPRG